MLSSNSLIIDQTALKHNVERLKQHLPEGGRLMAMVKGNGYGIGAMPLSYALQQCGIDIFGVSHLDEAIQLRQHGLKSAIFVVSAPLFELEKAVNYDLEVALSSAQEAIALNQLAKEANKLIKVHLHIDTGMRRFGCDRKKSRELYHIIEHLPHLHLEGIMSHFVGSSQPSFDSFSMEQLNVFLSTIYTLPKLPQYIHIGNSSALRRLPLQGTNMARVGLAFFGINCSEEDAPSCPLMKALTLTSRLHSIQDCEMGQGVGYFHTEIMKHKNGKIGIIPFGYHDGMPPALSPDAHFWLHNKKAPIIGRICMDFTLLDLSEIPEARVGDEVVIFDTERGPEQLALWANMNVRAILCHLSERIERKFISAKTIPATHSTL
jgi:alanine racemase/UDP-N-acetylmuramoyl-tripeptide--D-alanyl-D-alanine ligase